MRALFCIFTRSNRSARTTIAKEWGRIAVLPAFGFGNPPPSEKNPLRQFTMILFPHRFPRRAGILFGSLLAYACSAQPDIHQTPHVMSATEGMAPVPATIADLDWMVGAWEGPLGDDMQEHIAYPPIAQQMPGFVRGWTSDDTITFYEINAFAEVDGTLEFRVKHFSPELAGWEPQNEFVRHRLVAKTGNTFFFDGITFARRGPDRHTVHVRIEQEDGSSEIITVHQQRKKSVHADSASSGQVVSLDLQSTILRDNRIDLDPDRHAKIYLPPSYATSPERRYPVVYFCHNTYWSPEQAVADGNLQRLLERAFAMEVVDEFILVIPDYTGPTTGSLYENSPTSGRWLDYTIEEVIPLIDRTYRTLARRESRAIIGDFWGGYAALKFAMRYPETFGTAYGLHPVATGSGDLPTNYLNIDWRGVHAADSWATLPSGGRDQIFTAISQAFLPNAHRPPFYCDFPIELVDDEPQLHPDHVRLMQSRFLLEETLDQYAGNLSSLNGFALDWGRFDTTQAHVISNRRFSRKLTTLGIEHEAEEYAGGVWDKTWTENGRFAERVLPFLAKHLEWVPAE